MKTKKPIVNLVVDTNQLKNNLESSLKDKDTLITIMVKYGADGARDSNWIYGKITQKHTNKIFKFGIYLLTGKAVVLLIQSPLLITQEFENILKKECFDKINCRPKKFYYNYNWLRQIDEFCGTQLTSYTCVDGSQLQSSEKSFVEGLILEYQNLWIKKKGQVEKMEIKDKGVNVVGDREDKIARTMRVVLYNGMSELLNHLADAMNGLPPESKLTILDEVSKRVMKIIRDLHTEKGYTPLIEILDILKKNI